MEHRKYYDVTLPIHEDMAMYGEDKKPIIHKESDMDKGDGYNLTTIALSAHTGTHVDAPTHFLKDGLTLGQIPIDRFMGEVKVFELTGRSHITEEDLIGLDIQAGDKVFFKTDNGRLVDEPTFHRDYCALDGSAAKYLIDQGVTVIGVDYLSVEDATFNDRVHVMLMEAEVLIYEGLNLKDVPEGKYQFAGLPLRLDKSEGAPARVVLW